MDILQELAQKAKERIEALKDEVTLQEVKSAAARMTSPLPSFLDALSGGELSFICEVKRASPSKGMISENFPYMEIAKTYEKAGAAAISCLTEPTKFLGRSEYLAEIAGEVNIPVLRKDFTVDEFMIYEAKILGASAVLLICSILSEEQLREYLEITHSLGMHALVEAHDEREVETAVRAGARIIGVNNRNLRDFTVDIGNSVRLRGLVPKDRIFVSESGIKTPEDTKVLRENGVDAVLIGETLMKSGNISGEIARLRGKVNEN